MFNLKFSFKTICFFAFLILSILPQLVHGQQNVGIGTATPNSFSMLDISSSNKGLLIPRMALSATSSNSPIGAFVAGMQVYNTATSGDVTPGFYGCDGTKWIRLTGANDWSITGNAGTNPTTNFIGTTDDQDLVFKRNNIRAGLLNNFNNNTSWGVSALNPASTGSWNSAIGYGSLSSNTTGTYNTGLGGQSLGGNTVGSLNTAIGMNAIVQNKAGSGATAIGVEAMLNTNNTTTPFNNTNIAIGFFSLRGSANAANNTGLANNVIGYQSLWQNSSGSRNNTLGTESLFNNTLGTSNIAIGYRTLYNNVDRNDLIAIGDSTLFHNGEGAISTDDATFNTAVGSKAMKSNTTGYWCTALGYKSLMKNTTGRFNTAVGHEALTNLVASSANAAFGQGALYNQTGGNGANSSFGIQSMFNLTTGGSNTAIGWRSGFLNQTGEKNIFIGPEAGYYELGSNKLYIENSNADSTNALIFGNFASNKLRINGRTEGVYNVTNDDTPAIYGENDNTDYYGIGVQGKGGWIGVDGISVGIGVDSYFGLKGTSNGTNTGANYGVYGFASNSSKNYGVYGIANSGPNDYAGYFEGAVAIGNSTPKKAVGYLLSVNGKIATEEVLVDLDTDWPDYVFNIDYNLKPLEEVKTFINENGHLPNVPSAQDVKDNGILLGNMNKILMEKIEELTLYILQQEEKMKIYESRLSKLENK